MLFSVKKDISKRTFIIAVICIIAFVSASFLYFGNRYLGFFGGKTPETSDINASESVKEYAGYEYESTDGGVAVLKYNGSDKEITIPDKLGDETVVEIGKSAFAENAALTGVSIPDTVTLIGIEAFSGCSSLKNITLPESLTAIAYAAFKTCSSLEKIVFPEGVNIVGNNAFYGCESLKNITLSDNILYFGSSVFGDTAWYEAAEDGIVAIGNILYGYKGQMPEKYTLEIPKGIKTAASEAFYGCIDIVGIKYPDSFKNIGSRAFAYCEGLTAVNLPEGIRRIGEGAFEFCLSVNEVTVPSTVTEIDEGAFFSCLKLASVKVTDKNVYFISEGSALYTKDKTRLLFFCPSGGETDYVIPDTVTRLDVGAFFGCKNIETLTLPNSLTELPAQAFSECHALTAITVPDSVTVIGDLVFYGCESLVYAYLPENLENIGYNVFSYCNSLEGFSVSEDCESFTVSDGVLFSKNMDVLYVFPAAGVHIRYSVPKSVKKIAGGAFFAAVKLTSVQLPEGLEVISDEAFYECESISSAVIPSSVTEIGSLCYKGCAALKSVTIGKNVSCVGSGAFDQCYALKGFSVNEGNGYFTAWDGVLYSADKTKLICYPASKSGGDFTVPDTVISIEDYAFYSCFYLEKIVLPASISELSPLSFYKCAALKSFALDGTNGHFSAQDGVLYNSDKTALIKYPSDKSGGFFAVPETVLSIPNNVFENCTMLTKIEIGKQVNEMMAYSFSEIMSLTLICEKDSYAQSFALYYGFDCELLN